jgi:hypothetical protein
MEEFMILTDNRKNFIQVALDKITRKIHKLSSLRARFSGVYTARGLGYDQKLLNEGNLSRLQGYFQTYKYFHGLFQSEIRPILQLKKESIWFKNLLIEIKSRQIIVIHVRRGDYSVLSSSLGLLNREYYFEAISQAKNIFPKGEFWIFSDDINSAKETLHGIELNKCKWIEPPPNIDAAESLILMSFATAIITANSSFSWWSAATGNLNKTVFVPNPWFRKTKEPEYLIPEKWIRIKSRWI